MSSHSEIKRKTLRDWAAQYKSGLPITMLTAYDAVTARLIEQAGIDSILVGDSLGNVVLGYDTTIPVTLDDMIRHCAAVVRATDRCLIVCDLPFGIATDPQKALAAAIRVFQETGAHAVKLEGGATQAGVVKALTEQGIPVMGHIGLTPQFVHSLGGYYRHGKTQSEAEILLNAAREIERAGAFSIVLECIVPEVATLITRSLSIPTIGIGSGTGCSGQILVINDLIGLGTKPPPSFAKARANVAIEIQKAVREYISEVQTPSNTPSLEGHS